MSSETISFREHGACVVGASSAPRRCCSSSDDTSVRVCVRPVLFRVRYLCTCNPLQHLLRGLFMGAEAPSWGSVAQSDSEAWCLIEGDSKKVRLWRPPRRCAVHLDPAARPDHLGDSFAAEVAARSLR
jgi:hypothetical protein